jgi:Domain of unknown function (DUF1905)
MRDDPSLELTIFGEVWYWRGPAPYHFVTLPDDAADRVRGIAPLVSYGWGMIPIAGTIGSTTFTTSLWPKDGSYVVPLKDAVRRAEDIELGDDVTVAMVVQRRDRPGR